MTILTKIRQGIRAKHAETDKKPFLVRYKSKPTLLDHYRHLSQLFVIYEVLEKKLLSTDFLAGQAFRAELLSRSRTIKNDLNYIEQYLPEKYHHACVIQPTQQYVNDLMKAETTSEEGRATLIAHFLTRILGDLFGGQKIKTEVKKNIYHVFIPDYDVNLTNKGVDFYEFSNDMLMKVCAFLNKEFSENQVEAIIKHMKESFDHHDAIFDELEVTRSISSWVKQSCFTFFNVENFKKVAAAGLMAGTAAIAYQTLSNK